MVAAYIGGLTGQVGWLGLIVGGHLALSLHSSNELGELSQWPRHDDSIINIVISISISIIRPHRNTIHRCGLLLQSDQRAWSVGLSH